MIISASRRTDLPACYAPWLLNRLKAGFVLVRNPMNPRRISRVSLRPDAVEGLVLWTKNPLPLLDHLDALEPYPYYVQFTLTPYGPQIEPGLPDKRRALLPAFAQLARRLGPARVVWRYDPIFLSPRHSVSYHCAAFRQLAGRLAEWTDTCTISFLDRYRCMEKRAQALGLRAPEGEELLELAGSLSNIAREHGLILNTCAEEADLSALHIGRAHCVDARRLERILGRALNLPKDKNQRPHCGCAASVDIGAYDTCTNACQYCYASHSAAAISRNAAAHRPDSPLLLGEPGPLDIITDRSAPSMPARQIGFFDPHP